MGRDSNHIDEIIEKIKEKKQVNAFLIVLNGQNIRFDLNIKNMFTLLREKICDYFMNNTCIVFTRWEQSKRAKSDRNKNGVSEKSISNAFY
jgi:hypothetical protein